jgi:peptidoglycan/xylan/chitin deacetylase (PgdA/CDA1 family)
MYHEVTDEPTSTGFQRPSALPYKHPTREFEANLEQIARAEAMPRRIDRLGSGNRHLLLTFDDGGASALHAADMLERHGWPGHFFIVTGLIDTPCFLGKADIRDLHARGHLVGSHSHSHPDVFRQLQPAQMHEEWAHSRQLLEDVLGEAVTAAAIPGGHGDRLTERTAAAAGYAYLFTSVPTQRPWRTDEMLCLGRVCPKRGTRLSRIARLASGRGFGRELWLWRAKSAARACMGLPLAAAQRASSRHRRHEK